MVEAMEIKTGYKQTEVGVIPRDWEVKKVGEISDIDTDTLSSSTNPDYCFQYISIDDVDNGLLRNKTEMLFKNAPSRAKRKIRLNDVLISTVRPNLKSHLFIKEEVKDWICSTGFSVIRCENDISDSGFVYSHFFSSIINKQIDNLISGSNYPAINSKDVRSLLIPLPPTKAEQTAIATALNDVDVLITQLEKLIAKKRNIKQGAMQALLTGKRRVPGFEKKKGYKQTEVGVIPNDWDFDEIEKMTDITTGAKNTQDRVSDGDYPFFVRSQTVERINSYSFDGEAVLTAGDGVGTGKVFHYINGKFDFHQRVYKISDFSEQLDGYFFNLYFSKNFYNRIMQMTAKSSVDSVRREMIVKMLIPVPPKTEQTAIAQILSDMDTEIEALRKRLEKYKMIKQGMMQNLLTGRIRLV